MRRIAECLAGIRHNLDTVKNVLRSTSEARRMIRDFRPDVVIGTGGYVCFPVLTAAHELHIPTVIHESNAQPGLTTKLLSRNVDRILVGMENCRSAYDNPDRVEVTGTPVRDGFARYTRQRAREELGIAHDEKVVLSVWGSLGAEHMNAASDPCYRQALLSGIFGEAQRSRSRLFPPWGGGAGISP